MKVVIPAAGLGARFLPATKSQPKEMLPVVDKPIIQYVVEEAVAAGSDDILIITGRGKRALEDHFDIDPSFARLRDHPELSSLDSLTRKARIHFVRQSEPRGLADAISCARHHTGGDPFGVLLGDTINVCEKPLLSQLWEWHVKLHGPIIAVEPVSDDKVKDYGIVTGHEVAPGVVRCEQLIEKPRPEDTPSRLGITGAYVLSDEIYPAIDRTKAGVNGEVQLTDALDTLARERPVYATRFNGTRYDIGDRYLWLKTNLEFAYRNPEYQEKLYREMERLLSPTSEPRVRFAVGGAQTN